MNEGEEDVAQEAAEQLEATETAGEEAGEEQGEAAPRVEKKRARYVSRRKVCFFCAEKVEDISCKNIDLLRRYLSDRGKIEPRRKTGTCAKHQRRLTVALKRARHLALLPYTAEHIRLTGFPLARG